MERMADWNGCEVFLHRGDITDLDVDAIVNAANSELWPGGGVCGAIRRRGGRALAEDCAMVITRHGQVPAGQAAITCGGDLPAKHVIHAVGPFYEDDPAGAPDILASAYRNALRLARENGLHSIAFPCIGTGAYGYPQEEACGVAIGAVKEDLMQNDGPLERLIFCVFEGSDEILYRHLLAR